MNTDPSGGNQEFFFLFSPTNITGKVRQRGLFTQEQELPCIKKIYKNRAKTETVMKDRELCTEDTPAKTGFFILQPFVFSKATVKANPTTRFQPVKSVKDGQLRSLVHLYKS